MRTASAMVDLLVTLKPVLQDVGLRRVIPKIMLLVAGAAIAGIVAGGITLGLFYALYLALTLHAYPPLVALLMTLGAASFVLLLLVCWLISKSKWLRKHPLPPLGQVASIADAFMEGLRGTNKGD